MKRLASNRSRTSSSRSAGDGAVQWCFPFPIDDPDMTRSSTRVQSEGRAQRGTVFFAGKKVGFVVFAWRFGTHQWHQSRGFLGCLWLLVCRKLQHPCRHLHQQWFLLQVQPIRRGAEVDFFNTLSHQKPMHSCTWYIFKGVLEVYVNFCDFLWMLCLYRGHQVCTKLPHPSKLLLWRKLQMCLKLLQL